MVRELLVILSLHHGCGRMPRKNQEGIMIWAIIIAATYIAGIYVIRLVWWQE